MQRKVGNKVRKVPQTMSLTQVTKIRDKNHESRQRDLCRGLSWFASATKSATLSRTTDFDAKSA